MQRGRPHRAIFERQIHGVCAAVSIALLCSLGVLIPGMARGQTFDAPALVTADETGAFCYNATFTAGPGGFDVMLIVIEGFDNTDIFQLFDEPFCSLSLAEEQTHSFTFPAPHCPDGIGGSLLDLTAEGSVSIFLSNALGDLTCRGDEVQSFGGRTTILLPEPGAIVSLLSGIAVLGWLHRLRQRPA